MWTLVLVIATLSEQSSSRGYAVQTMTSIPGFQTEAICKEEGDKWIEAWEVPPANVIKPLASYNCIQVR